ncbi:glutathione S-transferase-like [Anopheles merus]|uniref:glutathione S-transferase-like n=1 Tax=Anopheles merus TaxID=30066 RepID=UPI001BE410EF|nr:glutathione S-transferase-like [Anopheles merus]
MPDYKVYYFNVKALGEPLRFLLSYGNLPFDDVRITREEWPALKPTMPMGQMPVLEVDGKKVHQSVAMSRYLANQVGLAGADDWENLMIDTVVDTVNDFRLKIAVVSYEPDDEIKEKKLVTLNNEVIPFYLEKLDDIARDNNGYLANSKLSWADIYFTAILDYLNYMTKSDLVANHPYLQRVVDNVTSIESIRSWIDKRPKTETMPMGQMPVLEVDGKRVHQSLAMCRYVAKQINLAGDNPLEALQIDAIVDTINDFRLKIAIVAYEPDDMVKEKKMVTLNNEVIPFYLTKLNVIAKENNGHLVLGKPTWADVYFAGILDYLNYLTKTNLLENFPNLQEVVQKVLDNENVKAYIAKRPITEV